MELWIRSQDFNKLSSPHNIMIMERNCDYCGIYCDDGNILGVYNSRERALEILDEIQGLLVQNDKVVYEMPKE